MKTQKSTSILTKNFSIVELYDRINFINSILMTQLVLYQYLIQKIKQKVKFDLN